MIDAAPVHFTIPAAIHAPAQVIDPSRFLAIIVAIEGNPVRSPGGIYGLKQITWRQHSKLPYRYAEIWPHNNHVALMHLHWLERSLKQFDHPVTIYALAASWNYGLEGGIRRMRAGRVDYAERAANLYFSAFQP